MRYDISIKEAIYALIQYAGMISQEQYLEFVNFKDKMMLNASKSSNPYDLRIAQLFSIMLNEIEKLRK